MLAAVKQVERKTASHSHYDESPAIGKTAFKVSE
jgi:hypothetical protein